MTTTLSNGGLAQLEPESISANPNNPRRYFNEERLDQLRTSLQEVGILVPLIVFKQSSDGQPDRYVLMDGERRWRCALDLSLDRVPANIIPLPSSLDNLLQMFNIHNVREDWPLISVALSLRSVMELSGEFGEKRLAEITGLTRSSVRRAKRILSLPDYELELIQAEAHLDRTEQVHKEDLYLEIEAAESVFRAQLPDLAAEYDRAHVIRQFAQKAETGHLQAVTDFRFVGKLVKAIDDEVLGKDVVKQAMTRLIDDPSVSPRDTFEAVASEGYKQQGLQRKIELLASELESYSSSLPISENLRERLSRISSVVARLLGGRS